MSTVKNSKAFVDRLLTDQELQQKFQNELSTPEAILHWAKAEGYQLDQEELRAAAQERIGNSSDALSEDELAHVAGGFPGAAFAIKAISGLITFGVAALGASIGVKTVDKVLD